MPMLYLWFVKTMLPTVPEKDPTFPILFQCQAHGLVSSSRAIVDSYDVLQRTSSSAAANAVSKLTARFAAGTGELAQLVRNDQDLMAETEHLDKIIISAVSKVPAERNAAAEDQIHNRIVNIKLERDEFG
jgi:hypothetical protein